MESQPDQTKKHYRPLHYIGHIEFLSDAKTPIPSWRLSVKSESDVYIDSNFPSEYNPSFETQVEGIVGQSKMASIELKELAYILALEEANNVVLPKLWDTCGFNSHNELIKILVGEKSENGEDLTWKVSKKITVDDVHSRVQCWYWLLCRWAFSEESEYFEGWRHIKNKLSGKLRPDQNCFYIGWKDLQEFFIDTLNVQLPDFLQPEHTPEKDTKTATTTPEPAPPQSADEIARDLVSQRRVEGVKDSLIALELKEKLKRSPYRIACALGIDKNYQKGQYDAIRMAGVRLIKKGEQARVKAGKNNSVQVAQVNCSG